MAKSYEVLHPIDFGDHQAEAGEVVELEDKEAQPLIEAKVVKQAASKEGSREGARQPRGKSRGE